MRYFTWDKNKARANIRKHDIDFETAAQVFNDPLAVRNFDQNVDGEIRWRTTGRVKNSLLVLVAHTTEEEESNEYVRIISARPALAHEREQYYAENRGLGLL